MPLRPAARQSRRRPVTGSSTAPSPRFSQPDDSDTPICRYLETHRLLWLLEKRQLYLPNIASLNEYFEGSLPSPEAIRQAPFLQDIGRPGLDDYYAARIDLLRRSTYVSCWRLGNDDSLAMWQLYCGDQEGVAIRTTYGNLVRLLANPWRTMGRLTYLNYDKDDIPEENVRYPYMFKRREFEYENEVRLAEGLDPFLVPGTKKTASQAPISRAIAINPADLIDDIILHPYAISSYFDSVSAAVRGLAPDLAGRVRWSELREQSRL